MADPTPARRAISSSDAPAPAWSSQALGWDALTTIAVAGAAVADIAVGTAVVPVPQRRPLVLAAQALTAQAAVTGRLTLGVGAGAGPQDVAIVGTETDVAQALTRFRDAGVTEFMAAPTGPADEQDRTVGLVAGLAGR